LGLTICGRIRVIGDEVAHSLGLNDIDVTAVANDLVRTRLEAELASGSNGIRVGKETADNYVLGVHDG